MRYLYNCLQKIIYEELEVSQEGARDHSSSAVQKVSQRFSTHRLSAFSALSRLATHGFYHLRMQSILLSLSFLPSTSLCMATDGNLEVSSYQSHCSYFCGFGMSTVWRYVEVRLATPTKTFPYSYDRQLNENAFPAQEESCFALALCKLSLWQALGLAQSISVFFDFDEELLCVSCLLATQKDADLMRAFSMIGQRLYGCMLELLIL